MEQLELQYQLIHSSSDKEKDELSLVLANKFIDQGDYQNGIKFNKKVPVTFSNKDFKLFLLGKAEFLIDNYIGSNSFLDSVDEQKIDKKYYWELQLYKIINFNHLLQLDSSFSKLSKLLLNNHCDTLGLSSELKALQPPKFFDLKKARRRSRMFPGAGLYYVGERRKAFTSALLNFAFIGYAAYSIYTKYYFTAALTGGAEFLRFYNGGKRASTKIGSNKNRALYLNYVLKLDNYCEKKILGLSKINN